VVGLITTLTQVDRAALFFPFKDKQDSMEIQACTTGATAALCAAIGGIVLTGGAAPEVGAIAKSGKAIVKGDIAAAKFVAKQAGTTLLGSDAAQTAEVGYWQRRRVRRAPFLTRFPRTRRLRRCSRSSPLRRALRCSSIS
jgi:hypothetical protein